MQRPPQRRSKEYGYEVEVQTLRALRELWPKLERRGSVAYKKSACDLWVPGMPPEAATLIVATKEKGPNPLLVTLSAEDFLQCVLEAQRVIPFGAAIQVKGRQTTWVGGLHRQLARAMKDMATGSTQ